MASKRRDPRGREDSPSELAAALAPHVDELIAAATQREIEAEVRARAERERPRRLDEAELMELIFTHLDDDNPRVCVGIDFDRFAILEDPKVLATASPASRDERAKAKRTGPKGLPGGGPVTASPARGSAAERPPSKPVASIASGHGWINEVQAVDPAFLDRPELDGEARKLLERARGRVLPTVNLRRLEREPAIAHLEFFLRCCRQQRARFVRAITGKGIESRAEPVIKREVLHWCRQRSLRSAPELDVHGEWGALVIELGRGHA